MKKHVKWAARLAVGFLVLGFLTVTGYSYICGNEGDCFFVEGDGTSGGNQFDPEEMALLIADGCSDFLYSQSQYNEFLSLVEGGFTYTCEGNQSRLADHQELLRHIGEARLAMERAVATYSELKGYVRDGEYDEHGTYADLKNFNYTAFFAQYPFYGYMQGTSDYLTKLQEQEPDVKGVYELFYNDTSHILQKLVQIETIFTNCTTPAQYLDVESNLEQLWSTARLFSWVHQNGQMVSNIAYIVSGVIILAPQQSQ